MVYESMLLIEMAGRHYHMHVLGVRQAQLQILLIVFFDDVESTGIFGNVGVQQVVVDVQEIVNQLAVVAIVVVVD